VEDEEVRPAADVVERASEEQRQVAVDQAAQQDRLAQPLAGDDPAGQPLAELAMHVQQIGQLRHGTIVA
jgi:hypothetical protein